MQSLFEQDQDLMKEKYLRNVKMLAFKIFMCGLNLTLNWAETDYFVMM